MAGRQKFVLAIDQGTTGTRAIVFDEAGQIVGSGQRAHATHLPRAGWSEQDPREIIDNVDRVVRDAMRARRVRTADLAAVGISNQRETAVVWDRRTGRPVHHAIGWQDTRTSAHCLDLVDRGERIAEITGLLPATFFSGPKIAWILDNVKGARDKAERGDLLFGTMDSWLLWNLTGGPRGGVHLTDVSNAARTLLMDLQTMQWSNAMCETLGVPRRMLPEIVASGGRHAEGARRTTLQGVPFAGLLGSQNAALVGQACFSPGSAKNTYGTGCFLLLNTGTELVRSSNGLISTVAYQFAGEPVRYALEGSVAFAGMLLTWMRDNLGFFTSAEEVEKLALSVEDNGGAYIVPAFAGLFAPHWRPDARGVIAGLTSYVTKAHLARAALESTAFQTLEVLEATNRDAVGAGRVRPITELRVDGAMAPYDLLMQFQADILGVPVVRPEVVETSALGAAYTAGLAVGFWESAEQLTANWREQARFIPRMDAAERAERIGKWRQAVSATLNWER